MMWQQGARREPGGFEEAWEGEGRLRMRENECMWMHESMTVDPICR